MKIWFNHWFSTAYYFIESCHKKNHYVIATNERESCVYKMNADEFYLESPMKSDEYLEWSIQFCKEHSIDVFFCKRHMSIISQNVSKFKDIGVKVVVENFSNISLFESKMDTLKFFKKNNICKVSEMFLVKIRDDFVDYYNYLKENYGCVCCKLDVDEGGQSFKKIICKEKDIRTLTDFQGLSIYEEDFFNIVDSADSFPNMILMPYLAGTEYSIDCYNTKNGLVAVPRYKLSNRITRIENNPKLIEIANKFQKCANLESAYNIQIREDEKGTPFLLEVNTRLSGGSWKDSFAGFDIISIILDEIEGIDTDIDNLYNNFNKIDVSNLESAIILE